MDMCAYSLPSSVKRTGRSASSIPALNFGKEPWLRGTCLNEILNFFEFRMFFISHQLQQYRFASSNYNSSTGKTLKNKRAERNHVRYLQMWMSEFWKKRWIGILKTSPTNKSTSNSIPAFLSGIIYNARTKNWQGLDFPMAKGCPGLQIRLCTWTRFFPQVRFNRQQPHTS